MPIVLIDELVDSALELGDRIERTAADGLMRDQPEPAFDLIEPGAAIARPDSPSAIARIICARRDSAAGRLCERAID
jgi:hypothetical protein